MHLVIHGFEYLLRPVTFGILLGRHLPAAAILSLKMIFD
jgi:hypothetical protein